MKHSEERIRKIKETWKKKYEQGYINNRINREERICACGCGETFVCAKWKPKRFATPSHYYKWARESGLALKNCIKRIASMPQTDTLPHRLLRKAMQDNNLWLGFEDEYPTDFFCIDIANPEKKIAIYVDGDYWHCNPEYLIKYKRREPNKIQKESLGRDKSSNSYLLNRGWKVLRFWESDIKKDVQKCIAKITVEVNEYQFKSSDGLVEDPAKPPQRIDSIEERELK